MTKDTIETTYIAKMTHSDQIPSMAVLIDPKTNDVFGVPWLTIFKASKEGDQFIYAPSGARLKVDHLHSIAVDRSSDLKSALPAAMELSMLQPGYDADCPVRAVISDSCGKISIEVDIGAWLLQLACGSHYEQVALTAIAQQLLAGRCGCNEETDAIVDWPAISNSSDMQKFFDIINHLGVGYSVEIPDPESGASWLRKHLPAILLDAAIKSDEALEFTRLDGEVVAIDAIKMTKQAVVTEALKLIGGTPQEKVLRYIQNLTYHAAHERGVLRCVQLVPASINKYDFENVIKWKDEPSILASLAQQLSTRLSAMPSASAASRHYVTTIIEMLCALAMQTA